MSHNPSAAEIAKIIAEAPTLEKCAFKCPHCSAISLHTWHHVLFGEVESGFLPTVVLPATVQIEASNNPDDQILAVAAHSIASGLPALVETPGTFSADYWAVNLHSSKCFACKGVTIFLGGRVIYPRYSLDALPSPDLPVEIASIFREAATISQASPRAAAALLRLCVERICLHLGKSGRIDEMIGQLVADGSLPTRVKQALDVVRVIGNESVHPGSIELSDDADTTKSLFNLVNLIAEVTIGEPARIKAMYDALPPEKREAAERRDARARGETK